MTNTLFRITALITVFTLSLTITSCKKDKKTDPETEEAIADESGQTATDSRQAQSENDEAVNDINQTISDIKGLAGKGGDGSVAREMGTICGLSVDTTSRPQGILVLNYNGTTCSNRTRTGSIKLTLQNYTNGTRWKDSGAVIKVEYMAYKVTRASDQKSIMLNGVQYLKNVSGGNWFNLLFQNKSLVSTITGTNLVVTWHDNTTAVYNINRRVTYTYTNSVLSCMAEGIGSQGNLSSLENYGTTRDGSAFTSQVNVPIVWNLTCGPWAPIQGSIDIKVASKSFNLLCLYGVDQTGNPVNVGANQCPYGWRLQWTVGTNTKSKVIGYI